MVLVLASRGPDHFGGTLNLESPWRSRFPGVSNDWARLDGPAGSQLVDTGINAINTFLRGGNFANDGGAFPASTVCDEILEHGRSSVATLLGAQPTEIAFNVSSTAHMYNLTRCLADQWNAGDDIVYTELEHDCNAAPWLDAARSVGARVQMAKVDLDTCRLDMAHLGSLITERTRWLALTAASNATGTVPDLKAIIAMAHDRGAKVLVDAVAYAPHRSVNVADLGCDALITSPYKWYAPHSGVLWLSPEVQEGLPKYQIRASHRHYPAVLEYGSTPYEVVCGVAAAADFLRETGLDAIRAHEDVLLGVLLSGLLSIPGVRVFGEQEVSPNRVPTVGCTVRDMHADAVCAELAKDGVAAWSGNFYALDLSQSLGLEQRGGWVRFGINAYVNEDDIYRAVSSVERIAHSANALTN